MPADHEPVRCAPGRHYVGGVAPCSDFTPAAGQGDLYYGHRLWPYVARFAPLVEYPFDTLKIDRSFVMRVVNGVKERMVTAAIIALAHAAGMTVVAEGVETREQLRLMHELGADEIQGYFFSRPLPASECEPFLLGRCDVARGGTASSTALA